MEGTVMLHILFAIKQDQDIGKELLETVKVRMHARHSVCQFVTLSMSLCACYPLCILLSMSPACYAA